MKEAKSIRGIPDIIGCTNGTFFALEVKKNEAESLHTTGRIVLQKHNMDKIRRAGGYASFVYPENVDNVIAELIALGDHSFT